MRTFEIGYLRNVVKIRKLLLFDTKCPYLGIGARNFQKSISDLKSIFEIAYKRNFDKIKELTLFGPKRPNLGSTCSKKRCQI